MLNKDWISGVLAKYENRPSDAHEWGKVISVNADGSYQVAAKGGTMRCESGCAASAGDVVWVCVTTDGKAVAQARKGGEGGTGGGGSGENGATFYPSVDADGNLSWTNDRGLTNPATVNIAGADGIYYGTEEPTQDPPPVWIDPSGTLDPDDVLFAEQDPTVPAWAKQENPPTYTAADVGALPNTTEIPTKVSELENDAGYLTSAALADKLLEAGETNGWTWRKWESGVYECWGIFTDTCTHYTVVTPFYGFYSSNFPYPITFPSPPIVLFNCKIGNGFGMPAGDVMRSSSACRCYALSTAKDTVTCVWEINVIGRWK